MTVSWNSVWRNAKKYWRFKVRERKKYLDPEPSEYAIFFQLNLIICRVGTIGKYLRSVHMLRQGTVFPSFWRINRILQNAPSPLVLTLMPDVCTRGPPISPKREGSTHYAQLPAKPTRKKSGITKLQKIRLWENASRKRERERDFRNFFQQEKKKNLRAQVLLLPTKNAADLFAKSFEAASSFGG